MKGLLIFKARTPADAKIIVDFWNYYCGNLNEFLGNASVYAIKYDIDTYKILNYYAFSSVSKAEKEVSHDKKASYESVEGFMTFPKDVRDKMIEKGYGHSPIPYILSLTASESNGGFNWDDSDEGWNFWNQIIEDRNFDLFYKQFNLSKHESRLCNEETPFGGGSDRNSSSIRSGFNKARVIVKPLSYQEVLGRG